MTKNREILYWVIIVFLTFRIISHDSHSLISVILGWIAKVLMVMAFIWMIQSQRNEQGDGARYVCNGLHSAEAVQASTGGTIKKGRHLS